MSGAAQVDPNSPVLTPYEQGLIKAFLGKRLIYMEQGRGREAHGTYAAVLIVWHYANERARRAPPFVQENSQP